MNCISCGKDLSVGEVVIKSAGAERHYCMWCALGVLLNAILLDSSDVGHRARILLRKGLDSYEEKHGGL